MDSSFALSILLTLASMTYSAQALASEKSIRFIDQITYRSKLLTSRPMLDKDSCAMDIRLKAAFQQFILNDKRNFDWILENKYPAALRETDNKWAQTLRSSEEQMRSDFLALLASKSEHNSQWSVRNPQLDQLLPTLSPYPGFYDTKSFISYQIGPTRIQDTGGFVYKVFFEFANPTQDLTPETYLAFSKQLKEAGFEGDSKIPVLDGWARFFYNNIIVHGSSPKSVLIAERVGIRFFGSKLSGYSRGVDVNNQYSNNQDLDWNNFLCRFDPEKLPEDVLRFVHGH